MAQTPPIDLNALWKYVTDKVKAQVTIPSLWRAMEAAKPVALDDDLLVMGFGPSESHQGGLIMDHRHKNMIEQVIEQATRKRLRLHVMSGDSIEEWEAYKASQVEAGKLQTQAKEQFLAEAEAGETWEAVGEQLVRRFGNTPHRGLSSVQGVFLDEALGTLAEAYSRLMPAMPDEHAERSYSRVLERISERVGVPAAMIAQLVLVRRRAG